jgi:hypothetical protein
VQGFIDGLNSEIAQAITERTADYGLFAFFVMIMPSITDLSTLKGI